MRQEVLESVSVNHERLTVLEAEQYICSVGLTVTEPFVHGSTLKCSVSTRHWHSIAIAQLQNDTAFQGDAMLETLRSPHESCAARRNVCSPADCSTGHKHDKRATRDELLVECNIHAFVQADRHG